MSTHLREFGRELLWDAVGEVDIDLAHDVDDDGIHLLAWTAGSGAWTASLDTVREDLGEWTGRSAFVEHSYAGSTAGPCTISLQPPG